MNFKIRNKSLTRLSLSILIILFFIILMIIPISTKSDYSGLKSRIEDPKITNGLWSRKMTVYTYENVHYYNVSVSLTIPEDLIEIELYRYLDSM